MRCRRINFAGSAAATVCNQNSGDDDQGDNHQGVERERESDHAVLRQVPCRIARDDKATPTSRANSIHSGVSVGAVLHRCS